MAGVKADQIQSIYHEIYLETCPILGIILSIQMNCAELYRVQV